MPAYNVECVNRDTGQTKLVRAVADDPEQAKRQYTALGYIVGDVHQVGMLDILREKDNRSEHQALSVNGAAGILLGIVVSVGLFFYMSQYKVNQDAVAAYKELEMTIRQGRDANDGASILIRSLGF